MSIYNLCGIYFAMCRTEGGGGVVASGRSRMDAICAAIIRKEAAEAARARKQMLQVSVQCMCHA